MSSTEQGAASGAPIRWTRLRFEQLDSTNEEAKRQAAAGAASGTVITADQQTAGRGRQGRSWIAPAGQTLTVSVLLRDLPDPGRLPLIAAVAVAETVGDHALIKWPNDIVLAGGEQLGLQRKVAGILCEGRPTEGWAVVGVGINVALDLRAVPRDIAARAGTMGRGAREIPAVLEELLDQLGRALAQPFADLLEAWAGRDALLGEQVRWELAGTPGGTGIAEGIDEQGRLMVRVGERVELLDAGEVHLGT